MVRPCPTTGNISTQQIFKVFRVLPQLFTQENALVGFLQGTVKIGIIMGSQSDWPTMKEAADMLDALKVPYEAKIESAHRTPDRLEITERPWLFVVGGTLAAAAPLIGAIFAWETDGPLHRALIGAIGLHIGDDASIAMQEPLHTRRTFPVEVEMLKGEPP